MLLTGLLARCAGTVSAATVTTAVACSSYEENNKYNLTDENKP